MGYFYNRAFKIGVAVGVMIFLIINVVDYVIASKEYEAYLNGPIKFAPLARFRWGFPFIWDGYNFGFAEDGVLNVIVATTFGIICGLIFRFFGRKL